MCCPQECYRSDGLNRSCVIEGQLNWDGSKEIVERNSIGNESTARLKQNVSLPHGVVASYPKCAENSLYGCLADLIGKCAINCWWKRGSLSGHLGTVSQVSGDHAIC